MSKDCIFCKIIKGEIPCNKIYEDKEFLAFLDIKPINKGHALIVPKLHCKNLFDFPKSEERRSKASSSKKTEFSLETDLIEFIKKISKAVIKATNADGFNLGMNNGRAAGQLVEHAHFHIIPRFSDDGFKHWPHSEYKEGEIEEIQKKIVSFL